MLKEEATIRSYGELMGSIINTLSGNTVDFLVVGSDNTPFGIVIYGNVIKHVMAGDNNSDAIYAVAQFVSIFSSLSIKSKEDLIEIVKSELIDDHFESELLRIYKETKGRNQFECRHAVLIEDFVANFKLENFSKSFQDRWASMQPYTLDFGSSKLIIGGRPYTAVDQLIATLDHFDEVGVFMTERFGLGRELRLNTSELKDIFGEWSAADLTINELIDLSKNCEVDSKAYVFVKNLIERIGLGALQEETRLAYLEVFPDN